MLIDISILEIWDCFRNNNIEKNTAVKFIEKLVKYKNSIKDIDIEDISKPKKELLVEDMIYTKTRKLCEEINAYKYVTDPNRNYIFKRESLKNKLRKRINDKIFDLECLIFVKEENNNVCLLDLITLDYSFGHCSLSLKDSLKICASHSELISDYFKSKTDVSDAKKTEIIIYKE